MTSDGGSHTTDRERLAGYVEAWKVAVDDVVTLLRSLDDADWGRPTDLPGWDVKAIACHLAHLESELSGAREERVDLAELEHVSVPTSRYTERGIVARSSVSPAAVVEELEDTTTRRYEQLLADPPTDGRARPSRTPGKIAWDWQTLLSNRVIDVWMHDQDIRRAVGRPGNMTGPAAEHTAATFTFAFPYVVGKRVAPPPGTTAVLEVTGGQPVHLAVEVDENGRAVPRADAVEQPTVRLRMDRETFVLLAGGRRTPDELEVVTEGDVELGSRILESMPVTP
jgi:uncharacterized protein (TIGR03083 family)